MATPIKMTKKPNGDVYLDEGVLDLYVIQRYIDRKYSFVSARQVETLGLLPLKYYKTKDSKIPVFEGTFQVASNVTLFPSHTEMVKVKVYPESDETEYTIIRFEKGDKIFNSNLIKRLDNVQSFTSMILGGILDTNIPYTLLTPSWIQNMLINDVSLNVPVTVIDNIVANLCRYKKDKSKTFAQVYGRNPKTSLIMYEFANIREVCASDSIFGALSFEDENFMIDSSLNMTAEGKEQRLSPLEAIIKV